MVHGSWRYILIGILVLGCAFEGMAQDIERIVAQNELAVVVITGTRSTTGVEVQSSGCVVDTSGLVLTTAHQIVGVGQLEGRLADGTRFPLKVLTAQLDNELALLKADRELLRVVRLGDTGSLRSGAPLISIATPVNLDFTTVTGIVSSTNRTYRGYPVIQSDLRASPGSSGGPIFDRNGDLVGLIIGKLGDEQWVTVINSVNNAFGLLREYGVTVGGGKKSSDMALMPVAGISEVELSAVMSFNRGVNAVLPEEKASEYARAATLLPAFYEAHFNYAVACTELNEYRKAEVAYRAAERLRPKSPETKRNLGRIFLREMRYEEAAALFEGVVQLAPQEAQSHNDAAEAYRQLNRVGEAILAYEKSLALDPSYAAAHFNLGLTLANAGDTAKSIEHFYAYLKHAPDASDVAQVRGWIAELQKQ